MGRGGLPGRAVRVHLPQPSNPSTPTHVQALPTRLSRQPPNCSGPLLRSPAKPQVERVLAPGGGICVLAAAAVGAGAGATAGGARRAGPLPSGRACCRLASIAAQRWPVAIVTVSAGADSAALSLPPARRPARALTRPVPVRTRPPRLHRAPSARGAAAARRRSVPTQRQSLPSRRTAPTATRAGRTMTALQRQHQRLARAATAMVTPLRRSQRPGAEATPSRQPLTAKALPPAAVCSTGWEGEGGAATPTVVAVITTATGTAAGAAAGTATSGTTGVCVCVCMVCSDPNPARPPSALAPCAAWQCATACR